MGSSVFAQAIDSKIMGFIHQALPDGASDEMFNQTALEVFAYQFAHNMAYRTFCMQRRATPDQLYSWENIPAVPTSAFKSGVFACFPAQMAVRVFETSGTTTGKSGKHLFDSLTLYDESAIPNFSLHLLPDGASLPMRILLPSIDEAPASSLVYMSRIVSDAFSANTEWYIHEGKLNVDALCKDLEQAMEGGEPRLLMGPSFSFVHFFSALRERKRTFSLPAGSRIMETGGYKGKSREMTRDQMLGLIQQILGIPPACVINEYGMTEMTSQIYDDTLRRIVHAGSTGAPVKIPPPWVRVRIIDPVSQEPSAPGVPGLIRILDLANRGSAIAIQTEDIGVQEGSGFRIIGRAGGAEPRGCSWAADEMLSK